MTAHRVAGRSEVGERVLAARAGSRFVILLEVDGELRAYRDRCPHQGVQLSRGERHGAELTCTTHGWRFDARTGACRYAEGEPCEPHALERYRCWEEEGAVWVDPDEILPVR